ncbi:hypothetical protein [Lonsdalea iberica]|uniref:hypothetical protein n=1 Tax=Lonsdalea iberica TaxID=1082703 RepID=UPI0020CAFFCE|nr:hypothetical protein [Lonsdalea iberica]
MREVSCGDALEMLVDLGQRPDDQASRAAPYQCRNHHEGGQHSDEDGLGMV